MPIMIEPDLQSRLDQVARQLGKTIDEIAGEAIRTHLAEIDTHQKKSTNFAALDWIDLHEYIHYRYSG